MSLSEILTEVGSFLLISEQDGRSGTERSFCPTDE